MRYFLYLKSNKSGIGDRLLDLMLIYTYSQYLNCEKLYLHWTEDNIDMTGNKSVHSTIRRKKTPFRSVDYLLQNLLEYIILPDNIFFVNQKALDIISKDSENIIFNEYMGMKYTLYSFMKKMNIHDKIKFETEYYNNFKKIQFKNIPEYIVNKFNNNDVLTVHLRRGDKVVNDNGEALGIPYNQLGDLDNNTILAINKLYNLNYKKICFVSDEKEIRNKYINLFKDKAECIYFDGTEISQTYFDLYCLSKSKIILLSQKFSVFSIFSSMINKSKLLYLLDFKKTNEFAEYENINKFNY